MNQIAAVVFDLDGVITDTAEFHYRAWQQLADELGITFDRIANEQFRGIGRADCLQLLLGDRVVNDFDGLLERKNRYYTTMLEQLSPADILPGAVELIRDLHDHGLLLAIGSASKNTAAVLQGLGLSEAFHVVVDGWMVSESKPDPSVFLTAARLLGVPSGLCLVVEDAAAGIDAGLAANMWTLGVGPVTRVGHAHAVVPNLDGLTWTKLMTLLDEAAWTIRRQANHQVDHHRETLFTIGNGHFCVRGTTIEGQAGEETASFMHGVWDDMPVTRTELANLPQWWGLDLKVNGIRLSQADRPGKALWSLDLRTGLMSRTFAWQPDPDTELVITDERLACFDEPHSAAVRISLDVTRGRADVYLRGGINGHVDNLGLRHWDVREQSSQPDGVFLKARTRASAIEVEMAAQFSQDANWVCDADGQPTMVLTTAISEGEAWTVTKYLALASSVETVTPPVCVKQLVTELSVKDWDELVQSSRQVWSSIWEVSDVVIDGDPAAQLALRYNLFQLMIAAPRISDTSIGAKALSGFGYRHHIFWDTEIFVLPFFSLTQPALARRMLEYRWRRLDGARQKAQLSGGLGARFPWESAGSGDEVCPIWVENPDDLANLIRIWTGDLVLHLNADIAYACWQYWHSSGDDDFLRHIGAELILDTATYWGSLAALENDGCYHLRDVMGPDEYHEHVDDNAFTNAMVVWHLRLAARLLTWLEADDAENAQRLRQQLGIDSERERLWQQVADTMVEPQRKGGVLEQHDGFFQLDNVDFDLVRDPNRTLSAQQIFGIEGVTKTQNIKQPDVLMLAYLLPELFTPDQLQANYQFYDPRTDHELGSSLGPAISAVIASRVGDQSMAMQHFQRAAQADLCNVRGNAQDGFHAASAGGLWQAVVFGFAGLKIDDDGWRTEPNLPQGWTKVTFNFYWRGQRQEVVVTPTQVGESGDSITS